MPQIITPINMSDDNAQKLRLASALASAKTAAKELLIGIGVGTVIAAAGAITGCSNYIIDQAEKDVATSTVHPRLAYDAQEDARLAHFRAQSAHASHTLAKMRTEAAGGVQ